MKKEKGRILPIPPAKGEEINKFFKRKSGPIPHKKLYRRKNKSGYNPYEGWD